MEDDMATIVDHLFLYEVDHMIVLDTWDVPLMSIWEEILYGGADMHNSLLKIEVMTAMGNFIINEGLPSPCYHPNEMNHLPAW